MYIYFYIFIYIYIYIFILRPTESSWCHGFGADAESSSAKEAAAESSSAEAAAAESSSAKEAAASGKSTAAASGSGRSTGVWWWSGSSDSLDATWLMWVEDSFNDNSTAGFGTSIRFEITIIAFDNSLQLLPYKAKLSSSKELQRIGVSASRQALVFLRCAAPFFFRLWATVLLQRCATLFGLDFVKRKLSTLGSNFEIWAVSVWASPHSSMHLNGFCNIFLHIWGGCSFRTYDLFGGALCVRQAWLMIVSAAYSLWGIQCGLTFGFNATWLRLLDLIVTWYTF